MKAFLMIYITQAKMYFRDKATLFLTLLLPLLLAMFFGFIFSNPTSSIIKIAIVDLDDTPVSHYVVDKIIEGAKELEIHILDELNAREMVMKSEIDAALILPEHFSRQIQIKENINLTMLYDKNRLESSSIAALIINNIVLEMNIELNNVKKIANIDLEDIKAQKDSLLKFYIPNFLAVAALWLSLFATTLPLIQQKESNILFRMGATPLRAPVFILGVSLWRLTIGFVQTLLFILLSYFLLKMDIMIKPVLLVLAVLLGNITFISLGIFITGISETSSKAEAICQLVQFPMMFLSGVFFTQDMLPDIFNKIAYLMPLSYLADIYRQVITGYEGRLSLSFNFLVLSAFCTIFLFFAGITWKWDKQNKY
jgi:ABC-2 type transport system permease protein